MKCKQISLVELLKVPFKDGRDIPQFSIDLFFHMTGLDLVEIAKRMQSSTHDLGSTLLNKVTERKKRLTMRQNKELTPFQQHRNLVYKGRLICFNRIRDKYKQSVPLEGLHESFWRLSLGTTPDPEKYNNYDFFLSLSLTQESILKNFKLVFKHHN